MLRPSEEELQIHYYDGFLDWTDNSDDTIEKSFAELVDVVVLHPQDGIDPLGPEDATLEDVGFRRNDIPSPSQQNYTGFTGEFLWS